MMDLFSYQPPPSYPCAAGFKTSGASQEAAIAIEASGKALTIRQAVLKHLQAGHVHTAEEIAEATGKGLHSVRSRLTELMECGLIVKLEDRGESEISGIHIHRWKAI